MIFGRDRDHPHHGYQRGGAHQIALAAQSHNIPPGWGPSLQSDYPFRIWRKDVLNLGLEHFGAR
eukprot:2586584-Prorocentrum_lima.AAC.1